MNTKGVNFQPSKRGQFSAAVDIRSAARPARSYRLILQNRYCLIHVVITFAQVRRGLL